jgi:hypothetical protein
MVKESYTHLDVLEHYETVRFTPAFQAYKMIDWWPIMDNIAIYSHIFSNLIIVVIAINYSVSFFMFFNICCVS